MIFSFFVGSKISVPSTTFTPLKPRSALAFFGLDGKIIRPSATYTGPEGLKFTLLKDRA